MKKTGAVIQRLLLVVALFASTVPCAARAQTRDRLLFAVVVTRHGVRSISKAPAQYEWAAWDPVPPSYLTARGYTLMTYEGAFYRVYFDTHGLSVNCATPNVFVYADTDQRTLATARALVEGMCGKPNALPVFHDADTSRAKDDPLFDGTQWAASMRRIDAAKSHAAVAAALLSSAIVAAEQRTDYYGLQRILDSRCSGTCAPVVQGGDAIRSKEGLSELTGPLKTASTYAEDLFLERAQCRPSMRGVDLSQAMHLHVLAYDVNARNRYNPLVRGGTLFAHIVAMLQAKAGRAHGDIAIPDLSRDRIAFFSGHDTQLGALGGILNAHWMLSSGLVPDDMPPGAALVFQLYRDPKGEDRVRLRFVFETMEQFGHYKLVPGGVTSVPVAFDGCSGNDCSVSLDRLAALSDAIEHQGLVRKEWTTDSSAPVTLDRLLNPKWTQCKP
jgi:4-phytase/acid phosphatase